MKIIQASFFWKNDKPGGLGFTFGSPTFSSAELQEMFVDGKALKDYLRHSDQGLGSNIVEEYLTQLGGIAHRKQKGKEISLQQALLAALNIIWLVERGFIPNDEFNGYQFVKEL